MGDVAVEQEVPSQPLTQPGPAFRFQVQGLGGADHFHVHAVRFGPDHRILHGPVLTGIPHGHLRSPRAALPANGAAMRMVGMEHFRSAVHDAELRRIPQITARNRRRRIAERIGTVCHGFIFEPEIFVLHVHVVDAERFAAIVQRSRPRTIGVRQRVALRQEVAVLVHRTKRFITHLMINQHEFAKIRTRAVLDHRLPPASVLRGRPRSQRIVVLRPARLDDKHPEQPHDRQFPVITIRMELPSALLGLRMDVPFHLDGLSHAVLFTIF